MIPATSPRRDRKISRFVGPPRQSGVLTDVEPVLKIGMEEMDPCGGHEEVDVFVCLP